MKKLILSLGLVLLAANSFSQVICSVEEPAGIAGGYQITNPTTWSLDMSNPANAVLDTVVLAEDSLVCAPITNDVSGKIALIYRGSCEYGSKALRAQNAGAIAVIIVNNIAGPPVPMGAGADGASVTIPVVMVSNVDGDIIHDAIESGMDVIAFIGEKNGYYDDDLGFKIADVLRADVSAMPSQLATNAAEFTTTLGGWVFNYGQNDQTGITLNATVNNGAVVYDQTSTAFPLLAGDSAFITLPDFSLASYPAGVYTITYTIDYGVTDQYTLDNTIATTFNIQDSLYALARLDGANGNKPLNTIGFMPSPNDGSFTSCIAFTNDNASRIGVAGMHFSASINAPDSLDGREILISARRWDDAFTDLNDPNFGFTSLTEVASAIFNYPPSIPSLNGVDQYVPFDTPIVLEDGQRYLFCVQTFDTKIFLGYDELSSYDENTNQDLQAFHPIESNGSFFALGFTSGAVPSIAVNVFDAADLTVNENVIETSTFPNPAVDVVTVKVNANGAAVLTITDLSGRLVSTADVNIVNGQFKANVDGFKSGTYIFSLDYANGTKSQFKVVVTK
ncbi:MAG TPA: PA domain-containing protein [Fluviicola sp.]|nr:PA domain-containing protein [Fluviicola sp.]